MKKFISIFALAAIAAVFSYTSTAFAQTDDTFKPHWAFNGQLFADYYYMMSADTVTGKGANGPLGKSYYEPNSNISSTANTRYYQAFDLRRVQLGANYWFTKDIIAKVLLEHENGAAANGDVALDAKRTFYAKEASITFQNAIPMGNVIFGQQATNVFSVDEGLMGYRSVEKSILDMRGMSEAGSNDLGIQLAGTFDNDKNFGYSALISNGNGAKDETDKYKAFTGELNAKFMDKHIVIDVSGDYMDKATVASVTKIVGTDTTKASNVAQSNSLIKVAVAYTSSPITVGVVYAMHTLTGQSNSVAGADADQTGLSIFARGEIIPKQLNFFARFDMFDPDSKADDNSSGRKETFIVAGLDWMPDASTQNVHIEPNFWMNTFSDKSSTGTDYEAIIVPRLTFAYKF
jgi:hypothetical protein